MIFTSDNWAGAHPEISQSLTRHANGYAAAYGASELDRQVEKTFNEIFGREVAVFFVGTGTAANSIALASASRPGGVAFCHRNAHVYEDECGAPDFFSGGRLMPVDGADGRIDADALEAEIDRFTPDTVHAGQPVAVTITQATEIGTVYRPEQVSRIAGIAHARGLPLHMDGARFANALAALDAAPAALSVELGVDMMSFGATKNGCWCAEAIVFFEPEKADQVQFLRKRGAHLFSKSRFIAAQFAAYFENGLWLDLARHSNGMAERLRAAISASSTARPAWKTETNEVFAILPKALAEKARGKGARFHDWSMPAGAAERLDPEEALIRLVTSFATREEDVDRFAELIG